MGYYGMRAGVGAVVVVIGLAVLYVKKVEGRKLIDRADRELVALLERAHPIEDVAVPQHRAAEFAGGHAPARFDFVDGFAFHVRAVRGEQRTERHPRSPAPNRQEHVVDAVERWRGIFDATTDRLEHRAP